MASLNRSQFMLVLFGLLVLTFGVMERAHAETLIYSNTNLTGYKLVPGYFEEVIDYGMCVGGKITKFTVGYETTTSNPGTLRVRFYRNTDRYSLGSLVRTVELYNLPGGWPYFFFYEYELTKEQQFYLPAGEFGYSYTFLSNTTGILCASGGTGNEDRVWIYDDDENEWVTDDGGSYYVGLFMEVYEGDIPAPPKICGYKFNDTDGDGSWDEGEPTMPGWEIFLDMNDNGIFDYGEPNSVTDPNGMYEFDSIDPGSYNVAEVLKDGWTQTCPSGDGTYSVVADVNEVYTFHFGNCEGQVMAGLSGYVLTDEDEPLEEVLMSASTGQSTMTNEYGYYELMLPAPWSGAVTPSKECFYFDPAERSYSSLSSNLGDQDFTAIPSCFYGSGAGTEGDPYLINTAEHMQEIGTHPEHWASHFKLMNDIDLAAYTGDSFNIIGYFVSSEDNHPFSGVFDGNNHRIYNFTYITDAIAAVCIGLFGYVDDPSAEIKNLTLVDPLLEVEECVSVGSVVGGLVLGTVNCCAVLDGTVVAYRAVGGLVGNLGDGGIILDSYTRCTVAGDDDIGGLVGYNRNELLRCYSVSDVSGLSDVGTIIGSNDGTAAGCFYDSDTSMLPGVGEGDTSGVIGETTENMQAEITFTDAGWDFAGVWDICEGTNYPKFIWHEPPVGDLVCPDGVEVADFAIISTYWLQADCGDCGGADLSGDGDVGLPDVEIFVDNWMVGVGI